MESTDPVHGGYDGIAGGRPGRERVLCPERREAEPLAPVPAVGVKSRHPKILAQGAERLDGPGLGLIDPPRSAQVARLAQRDHRHMRDAPLAFAEVLGSTGLVALGTAELPF